MRIFLIRFCLLFLMASGSALAQNWPEKPIRMVIPFSPGGVSDVLGRYWAQKLSLALNTSIVVENRPGAGTTIAANFVAKSQPDGYTLFFTDVTTHAINATLYKTLAYKVDKDFTEIALVADSPLVFVVPASFPANSMAEFIAYSKTRPGELNYASSGNGTILHLSGETLKNMSGINLMHIPFKGSTDAVMATLSGQTAATFSTIPAVLSQVKAGKFKALGVTSVGQNQAFPGVAPMGDTIPGFSIGLYSGILGPAGIPPKIVERINSEVSAIMKESETKKLYASFGADAVDISPGEFTKLLRTLTANMGQAVKRSGAFID